MFMPKEIIQLGHSVEKHSHHDAAAHHHGPSENEIDESLGVSNRFDPDSLSSAELLFTILFAGLTLIGVIALIIFLVFR